MNRKDFYIVFTALMFTAFFVAYVISFELPVRINAELSERVQSKVHLYEDFTKDGYDDVTILYDDYTWGKKSIQIYIEPQHSIVDQINFSYQIRYSDIYFEDWNNDGYKDIVAFSNSENGTHLTVYSVHEKKLLVKEKLIYNIAERTTNVPWNPTSAYSLKLFTDANDKKEKAIFEIQGAFNFNCRSIVLIDRETFEVDHEYSSVSAFNDIAPKMENQNVTGFWVAASSPMNTPSNTDFSDSLCWLYSFDKNLSLLSSPIPFPHSYANFSIIEGFAGNLFFQLCKTSNKDYGTELFKLNGKNEIDTLLISKDLFSENWGHFSDKNGNFYRLFSKNIIIDFDQSFNRIRSFKADEEIFIQSFVIFNEYTFVESSGIFLLLDKNLNLLGKLQNDEVKNSIKSKRNCIIETGEKFPALQYFNQSNEVVFKFKDNFIYNNILWLSLPILGLNYFLINLLFYLFIRFALDYKTKRKLIHHNENGILLLDDKLRIKYINEVCSEILDIKNENLQKKHYSLLGKFNNEIKLFIDELSTEKKELSKTVSWIKNGDEFNGKILMVPMPLLNNFITGYLIEITNFTGAISAERILSWTKTNQKIAHEFKTPLSTIKLNLNILKQRLDLIENNSKKEILEDISFINEEINRISALTKNFLQLSNTLKPNFAFVSLNKILDKSLERFESYFKNSIELIKNYDDSENPVFCDPIQIEQLLHILIENAIDATPEKGIIEIHSKISSDYYEISVSDNGKVISSELTDKIFEPYFTTKQEGTGLGLAIAKNIVSDHNGELFVKNNPNGGTIFICKLKQSK